MSRMCSIGSWHASRKGRAAVPQLQVQKHLGGQCAYLQELSPKVHKQHASGERSSRTLLSSLPQQVNAQKETYLRPKNELHMHPLSAMIAESKHTTRSLLVLRALPSHSAPVRGANGVDTHGLLATSSSPKESRK